MSTPLHIPDDKGVTLIELLVVIAISGIVIMGLSRFLLSAIWTYDAQDRVTQAHTDAQYAIKKMADVLMEVGADLPIAQVNVIQENGAKLDSIALIINPRGGTYTFSTAKNISKIPISNANGFIGAAAILVGNSSATTPALSLTINAVDTTPTFDTVVLSGGSHAFKQGDVIYAVDTVYYFLKNGMLCLNDTGRVIAENLDTLRFAFYDSTDVGTTNEWKKMKFAHLAVTSKTELKDIFTNKYHRVPLYMNLRLKNKL